MEYNCDFHQISTHLAKIIYLIKVIYNIFVSHVYLLNLLILFDLVPYLVSIFVLTVHGDYFR